MYSVHKPYEVDDAAAIEQVIAAHPFATVITQANGAPFANHFPIFHRKTDGQHGELFGHMFHHNTQLEHFRDGQDILTIFHGPHCYVPAYADCDPNAVPTYSYIAVHAYGTAQLVDDHKEKLAIVAHTVTSYGTNDQPKWNFQIPQAHIDEYISQLTGFRIPIDRIETQFKLVQDRPMDQRQAIQQYFSTSENPAERVIAEWMKRFLA
jgi:transcriptional regulator